jgi:hypothetical protein
MPLGWMGPCDIDIILQRKNVVRGLPVGGHYDTKQFNQELVN